jgi:predicted nucleotidyltransferase
MCNDLQTLLGELRQRLQALYGPQLEQLVLFGSQARREAGAGSDVDILVVLRGAVNAGQEIARTGSLMADLSLKYDTVVSCLFISSERYATEESPLLLNVRREGVAA